MNYSLALQKHNLKITPQRIEIVHLLHKNGHLDIENLYKLLLKKFSSLSLATVYKNIKLMRKNFFLQEVKIPNKKNVYEISKEQHSHLVCSKCFSITDIKLDLSKYTAEMNNHTKNYKIDKSCAVLIGICSKCI